MKLGEVFSHNSPIKQANDLTYSLENWVLSLRKGLRRGGIVEKYLTAKLILRCVWWDVSLNDGLMDEESMKELYRLLCKERFKIT